MRDLLQIYLLGEGHHVAAAGDGAAALDLVARAKVDPDLLLTDYNLPGDMNGIQLAARLREVIEPPLPVVVLTGDISAAALLDAVGGVGAWTYDVASDRFFCDAAIAELYGLDVREATAGILREGFLRNVHAEDRAKLAATMSQGLTRGGDLEMEYRIVHPDGSLRWVLSRGHTYVDGAGQPVRRTGVGIDMTRQRQLEEQLRQSQKMEAIGQLTGGVAHDFNNLLTVIRSSAEMLQRPAMTEERRRRHVEAISATTTRAAKLTAQLLAFARRQALKPAVFDVSGNIEKIGDMIATLSGSRISVETRLAGEAVLVNADPSQFDVALVNLVVNARDAMGGEGRLTIVVEGTSSVPPVRGQPEARGDYVAVAVTDTGSGIPAENMGVLFEPFFTTKTVGQGTGLGLSQVFGFVKQSGGEVCVESTVGVGTTFTVYLPRVRQACVETRVPTEQRSLAEGHGIGVLLVEDNGEVGASSAQALGELGYRIVLAPDAERALAELASDAGRFDVVFSDVVMPGIGGIELGREIRVRYPDLPIVLTSGYSHVLAENGTFGFELLQKPYSIHELSQVLQTASAWRSAQRVGNVVDRAAGRPAPS